MSTISQVQEIILRHMTGAMRPGVQLKVRDFEPVATVSTYRDRWANKPLNDMKKLGFVEAAPFKGDQKTFGWRITMRGLEALLMSRTNPTDNSEAQA